MPDVRRVGNDSSEASRRRIENEISDLNAIQIVGIYPGIAGLLQSCGIDFSAEQFQCSACLVGYDAGRLEESARANCRVEEMIAVACQGIANHRFGDPAGRPELPFLAQGLSRGAGGRKFLDRRVAHMPRLTC